MQMTIENQSLNLGSDVRWNRYLDLLKTQLLPPFSRRSEVMQACVVVIAAALSRLQGHKPETDASVFHQYF